MRKETALYRQWKRKRSDVFDDAWANEHLEESTRLPTYPVELNQMQEDVAAHPTHSE